MQEIKTTELVKRYAGFTAVDKLNLDIEQERPRLLKCSPV